MMMIQMVLILSVLGSYVVVMSDEVNLTATIPPGYALQDYLCSGPLKSHTTVVLDDGEHRISSGPPCANLIEGYIVITAKGAAVRCEGEGRVFRFNSTHKLTMERITFINCGIHIVSTETAVITNCIFKSSFKVAVLSDSSNNICITSCVFQSNSGGGVKLDGSTGNISIRYCTFQNNSATFGGAVWARDPTGNVSFTNCTFLNNSATYDGGAVWLYGTIGYVGITDCTFQNNSAAITLAYPDRFTSSKGGGAVWVRGSTCNFDITNCIFQNNRAAIGSGGCVWLDESNGDVGITNSIFENNSAMYGDGGALMLDGSTGNINIANCIIQNNRALYGDGGALMLDGLTGNFNIANCIIHNNSASFGGGISFSFNVINSYIYKSTFSNNYAVRGAAIHARNAIYFELGYLYLLDIVVKDNHCSGGGAIYFDGVKVDIFGNTPTGSQFSSNSAQGAIQGQNGFLLLHGSITFAENRGVNGGAISLSNNVPLYFYKGCRVEFSRNVATGLGGAIYNDRGQTSQNKSILSSSMCIIRFIISDFPLDNFSITFTDNHAQQTGHAVYATPIYDCIYSLYTDKDPITDSQSLTGYFTITPLPEDINDIQVISSPAHVLLCGCNDPKLCIVTGQYQGKVTTYPGGTVRLNITSVGDGKNLSPSVVYTQIDTSDIKSQSITLGPSQKAQWIGTVCGTIEYQIYGPASFKLLLSNTNLVNSPAVIEVELLPCEPGFTLSSTGQIKCDCSLFFTSLGVVCDTLDGTVTRNKNNWIGVYNNTFPALASTCPLDYCNSIINKLPLGRPGDLCSAGRTGILCGHCHGNLSAIFGSSKCQVCTDMWLITLVMFAVLGVLLVAALFFLNLTVTQGTLYGLIFYANIIQVNTSIFFSQSILNPMKVIVSFVNLDLGLPLCFYDGMDDADKAGLQFVFPVYLLILTMTVIVLCHYCLQRSPTSSTSSCWYRFPIILGERAVGILSTLIYLSYSKLLRTVIDVFTYSTVHLPTGDMYVWFYNGNVEYLHGKHTVLFMVAMLTCALFLLPYTFALTFIPIIEHYSEHNRLFNYLHKKANQMKPMNDAHYAPYKGEWRCW